MFNSKKNKNIVFIGFMGSGKSSTSKCLAKLLKRKVLSTDQMIVAQEKKTIAKIFKKEGEPYFRELEKKMVAKIFQKENIIVDCGGGVVLNPDNIKHLKKNGILIYLYTSPAWIYKRIMTNKKRPLLNVKNPLVKIKQLLKDRQFLYRQADHAIDTDGKTPEEVALKVRELLKL